MTTAPIVSSQNRPFIGSLIARLTDRLAERRLRAQYREMLEFDDHLLRDIGVARSDVAFAARLPLSKNARAELTRLGY